MNRLSRPIVVLLFVLSLVTSRVWAQTTAPATAPAGPPLRQAILVTLGPGDEIWERFGHNMIWVIDRQSGYEACYNWGLFDFDEPGFIRKFIQGDMTYWMDAFDPGRSLIVYQRQNRTIRLQRLNFTDDQILDLLRRCEKNRLPENRHYSYDYYKQNCTTKVRDMLDAVSGGELSKALKERPADSGLSYRQHTMRAATEDFWMSLGMDLLLGPSSDRPLTAWEESFLPAKLADYATPLVRRELEPLWGSTRPPEPAIVPQRTSQLAVAGGFFAFILLAAGLGNRRWTRVFAVLMLTAWWAFSGIAAVMMLYIWAFTRHWAGYANQNQLHFSILSGLALLVAIVSWKKPAWWRGVVVLTTAAAGVSILGLLLKTIGVLGQDNLRFALFGALMNVAAAGVARLLTEPVKRIEVAP